MSEEEKKKESQISRRQFLKDAGLIVGGATLGSVALVNACGSTTTVTAPGATSTKTVTSTATTTVAGPGGATVTTTVAGPGSTSTVTATKTVTTTAAPSAATAADESLVNMTINGVPTGLVVKNHRSLAEVLREQLSLFALKEGCQFGECGACTVMVDDKAVFACLLLACEMNGKKVVTVEGLSNNGVLDKVQQKFWDQDVAQCGYCTPGFIMAAEALYKVTPKPTLDETREALAGHVCMCGNVHRNVNCVVGGV